MGCWASSLSHKNQSPGTAMDSDGDMQSTQKFRSDVHESGKGNNDDDEFEQGTDYRENSNGDDLGDCDGNLCHGYEEDYDEED
ncbi:hypothetical protein F0562_029654 [Nyssa sinensis]|uniref:Uncharacterized protein n=1 Tax=Nyssa sinensis TaxID=561372 RepID=A0A5J5B3G6_9ASTE|nr:hypothetical protein F0562_029654 [Nyssa sinensis]